MYYGTLLRSLALRGLFVQLCPSVRERAPRVRFSHFGSFSIPQPPLEEQTAIMDTIYAAVGELDSMLERTHRETELLLEYHTRLIADVVTGKLDVREAAAHLPEEIDESEPLDEADAFTGNDEVMEDNFDNIPEEAEA